MSARAIAETLTSQGHPCGKTQISNIIKRKREWIEEYENNAHHDMKRKLRKTGNEELNATVYEWFKDATARMMPVSGPLFRLKATEIAAELKLNEFKASNGWLVAFRKRHNVFGKMSSEHGGVDSNTIDDWKAKLPELCSDYQGADCSGGKCSKDRLTLMLCANAGEKKTPLVIGKSINPRCFKRLDRKDLPVDYHANRKAWMTSNFFELWAKKLDAKMRRQDRKILLILDNAPSHPKLQLTNIKLLFLPPNTTSVTQPMDQGIIQATKLKFRKRQLTSILHRLEAERDLTAPELMKSTNVLQAIQWISRSWNEVEPETIKKCFRRCEIGQGSLQHFLATVDSQLPTTDNSMATSVQDLQH
ncbi:tigger transposable element-derived protein 4-like [Diadema antillarum]|uniref:tigger transposable element-derived protein 4-like n=1 Tax=Diadema antillarum TaxID=105358 RepID=UPI003A8AEAC4